MPHAAQGYCGSCKTGCRKIKRLEEKELIAIIEDFLRDLSQENRVIFLRRYWFSDSYAEIAARTGLTEKNVSVRLSRIRKQLQTHLAERGVLAC